MSYPTQLLSHSFIYAGMATAALIAGSLLGSGSKLFHLVLLLALLPFLGILHGALDYDLAKRLFYGRFGRNWVTGFIASYLVIMAVVLIVWWIYPGASLAAFLAVTLYHFGTGDALTAPGFPRLIRTAEAIGRGGTVLAFPAVFDQQEVLVLLSLLASERDAQALIQVLASLAPLCGICLAVTVLWSSIRYYRDRIPLDLARIVELVAVGLTFAFLPALLAFTIYFNLLHSVRHMLQVAAAQIEGGATKVWGDLIRTAVPVTAVTFLMGGAAYLLFTGPAFNREQLFRVIFIGIASMTYPHMAVVWLARRARIISAISVHMAAAARL